MMDEGKTTGHLTPSLVVANLTETITIRENLQLRDTIITIINQQCSKLPFDITSLSGLQIKINGRMVNS